MPVIPEPVVNHHLTVPETYAIYPPEATSPSIQPPKFQEERNDSASVVATQGWKINLYPNPTQEGITIESSERINSLSIYDIYGRVVLEQIPTGAERLQINLNPLESGIYLLKVSNDQGEIRQQTFVKQ